MHPGTTWHNVAQRGTTWHNVAQRGTTWHNVAQLHSPPASVQLPAASQNVHQLDALYGLEPGAMLAELSPRTIT